MRITIIIWVLNYILLVEDDKIYLRLVIQKSNVDCHSEIKTHLFNV